MNIEQSGQADVNVDQAEARVVIDGNTDPAVTIDGTDGERAEAVSTDVQPPADPAASMFADVRVSDLVGMDVRGETGNEVGEIDSIVKGNDGLVAIVGVGGFLGLGEHEVAIALDRFERSDDVLILNALTESELEAMPAWDKSGEVQALDMMVGDIK
ncbi:PRC-barrel domain-containing protein [Jannaschia helgolandensis]|uniref:PRC-barrel domain-containing protein n=1 Tax=Jannaschia helgolandensis TaxID=188906 RepID=UPI0030D7128F